MGCQNVCEYSQSKKRCKVDKIIYVWMFWFSVRLDKRQQGNRRFIRFKSVKSKVADRMHARNDMLLS